MLRGRRTTVAAVCVIAATAAVTAGCGGGTSSALQLDPVSAAVTKTQNAGAAHVRLSVVLKGHGRTVRLHAAGAIDGTSAELSSRLGSLLGPSGIPAGAIPGAVRAKL